MYEQSRTLQVNHKRRTINRNSNTLRQLIAVRAYERGDKPKLIDLQIVGAERAFGDICVHNLEVELVGFSYSSNGCRTWVALPKAVLTNIARKEVPGQLAYLTGVQFSKSHDCKLDFVISVVECYSLI